MTRLYQVNHLLRICISSLLEFSRPAKAAPVLTFGLANGRTSGRYLLLPFRITVTNPAARTTSITRPAT